MAVTKYLDSTGVGILWNKTKAYADARKKEITDAKGVANGFASLDANGNVPLSQLGNIDTTLLIIPADNKLPTTGIQTNKIYLIKENSETNNVYTEYVYVNNAWEILGKFAVKVDLSPYATTSAMNTALAGKVDKVSGKGLSTNDFTTTLLNKLNGIADGANKTVVDNALSDTSTNPVQNKVAKAAIDTKADKSALANYVPTSKLNTTGISATEDNIFTVGVTDKRYLRTGGDNVNGIYTFNQDESGFSVTIDSTDGITITANDDKTLTLYRYSGINYKGEEISFPSKQGTLALTSDIPDISGKVDKVNGKGLSTNDFTTTLLNKLNGIADGATKVSVDGALSNTSTNPVQNKVLYSSISTINTTLGNKANSSDVTTALAAKLNSADIAAITETELNNLLV